MSRPDAYHLFEAFGVELEYMIVDRATLAVRPLADRLLYDLAGAYVSDVDRDGTSWSNELVNHVLEMKTHPPAVSLAGLAEAFHRDVRDVNERLAAYDAMLLPTGAHPFMDPFTETVLWPHEYSDVYRLYNRIFDCRGHGWANLQSTHLNLPFEGDAEFGRLHAAIRVLLPLLPALSASTPVLDGRPTGFLDTRLETYRHNQKRIPVLTGAVVPEPVFTRADYQVTIFDPIRTAIAPFDTDTILDQHFLNSRGAIARFDRGAIEIRVLDLQECPRADLAVLQAVVAVLRRLVDETWSSTAEQQAWPEGPLAAILLDVIRNGEQTEIADPAYLGLFGLDAARATAGACWHHLFDTIRPDVPEAAALTTLLEQGPLARRILRRLGDAFSSARLLDVYHELAACLASNTLFEVTPN